jgi:hypothetical protein
MRALKVLAAVWILGACAPAWAEPWKPADGPLVTRWAKDVSPDNAHPEYPRPQMVRSDWLNLNGLWQLADAKEGEALPAGRDLEEQILVPFPVESALSGAMRPAEQVWYRRTFQVPDAWKERRVLLHFQAVDWEATVFVNGKELGTHRGGYDPFSLDVTGALVPGGDQELIVRVFDPTSKGDQPRGKQVNQPKGIFYTSTTGIWQTAWLEPVPDARINGLKITPDVDAGCVRLTVEGAGTGPGHEIQAVVRSDGAETARGVGRPGEEIEIPIPRETLRPWSPDDPFLYDLEVTLSADGKPADTVRSYFGMRKIDVAKDPQGFMRLRLNGQFLFQVGPLDQGFWPDGLYTAPTDEALRYDIEVTKKLGFNMARKHVKVEPQRWYYWCDKLGLLVWQDMPSGNNKTDAAKKQFEQELKRMVESYRNHPSIIMWVVFNEGWGQHDTERYVDLVKGMDPGRLVNNASGWTDKQVGDVMDIHRYPGPGAPDPEPEPERTGVLGEFGGLGLAIDGHTWTDKSWGYRGTADRQDLTSRYVRLLRQVWDLDASRGLAAAVYTQTTDVETECNGLLTYDRAIIKVDVDKVAAANRGQVPKLTTVAPTAEEKATAWRYMFDEPPDGWAKPGFDDSSWKEGPAGFGAEGTPGSVVRTVWSGKEIWIRREFELPSADGDLALLLHHDEDVEVYLNGVLAAKEGGYTTAYEEVPISAEARRALRSGKNLVAVHCRQTQGGQYIDVGMVRSEPIEPTK